MRFASHEIPPRFHPVPEQAVDGIPSEKSVVAAPSLYLILQKEDGK
ncbi:MAG: hypothetical protein LBE17_04055 [Treponema sp.]|nr:hypothetical protein [Treponema sp.]